jgi:hypothetical protein
MVQGRDACVALWLNLMQGEKKHVNNRETYGSWYSIPHDTCQ